MLSPHCSKELVFRSQNMKPRTARRHGYSLALERETGNVQRGHAHDNLKRSGYQSVDTQGLIDSQGAGAKGSY
jgi:hypothetical protein